MRKISDSKTKWKLGLHKLRRQSTVSEPSVGESSIMEEQTTEVEVQDYFAKLKKKTGLNQLWSGRKFSEAIDKYPDIDLSEEPKRRSSTLRELTLDSDEEDLQDFIHNLSDYEKSAITEVEEGISRPSSSYSNMDLMKNINFAEVGVVDNSFHDSIGSNVNNDKDFMPLVVRPEFDDTSRHLDHTESSQSNIFKTANINFVASDVSSLKVLSDRDKSIGEDVESVSGGTVSELSEEIPEVSEKSRVKTPATPVKSHDYTSSKFESYESGERSESVISTFDHTSKSVENRESKHSRSVRKVSTRHSSQSDDARARKSKVKKFKDLKSADIDDSSRKAPTKSREESFTSDSSITSTSRSSTSLSASMHKSRKSTRDSRKQDVSQKVKKKTANSKTATKEKSKHLKVTLNELGTLNTELHLNNNMSRYLDPSPIATTVVDQDALEAVTSYNPTMLALNDLMKYQIQLTRQHIDNSWRLYKAYAEPEAKGSHKYTTLKDTMKYLKQNAPSVVTYEEALNQINKENE